MILETIVVGPLEANCYLVGDAESRMIVIVDPGDDADGIAHIVQCQNYQVQSILATHGHIDHTGAVKELQDRFHAPFLIHAADSAMIHHMSLQSSQFGLYYSGIPAIGGHLEDDQILTVGKITFQVIHTPGHTPGSVCLLGDRELISGDTLFAGSIGRTDLPGGNTDSILRSIKTRILVLDPSIQVFPGHGPRSTVDSEKRFNPFLID